MGESTPVISTYYLIRHSEKDRSNPENPDPELNQKGLGRAMAQGLAEAGAHVVVMDLARPASETAVDSLVETYALNEPDVLRRDFRNSLFAAYTVDEVEQQLQAAGLDTLAVQMVSDRHLAVTGRIA